LITAVTRQSLNNNAHRRGALIARQLAWPALLLSSGTILWIGFESASVPLYFNLSYAWIVAWLLLLERAAPYRDDWRFDDGQLGPDLSHTVLTKGLVQLLIVSLLSLGLIDGRDGTVLSTAPLWLQVGFGLVASEFGLYWAHRLAHEWPLMWRFHAVHHSVERLWLVNTGRFHFVDSLLSVVASLPFLFLGGLSMDAIVWVSAITAYIGILTHCNADMHCGWLNYVFNTPNLHRWHHSTETAIGNNNYGENLMLWDMVFGTYFHRPGANVETIGIAERMPAAFTGQLLVPFVWTRYQSAASA
jgi:ornithine lipid hydroxylase